MKNRLKAWLPQAETIRRNRWLRWLHPLMHQPRLWHMGRRGIALGLAIGVFFGLLIPVAQIPVAATVAVLMRANLPVAVGSTLVTNPVTFGPVYYGAYRLGQTLLGQPTQTRDQAEEELAALETASGVHDEQAPLVVQWTQRIGAIGKPLFLGLAVVATASGLAAYALVSVLWALRTRWTRRQRLRRRLPPASDH